jgi:molecular chaperone IbpA
MHEIIPNRHRLNSMVDLFDTLETRMIGFDRQWRMLEELQRSLGARSAFPPFNLVETGEDHYRIEFAVAGFSREELSVRVEDRRLVVEGDAKDEQEGAKLLHRGIATRRFRQSFALAEHVEVTGADLRDGILRIDVARVVPEDKKPRTIEIA